jgi:hypothetical protein
MQRAPWKMVYLKAVSEISFCLVCEFPEAILLINVGLETFAASKCHRVMSCIMAKLKLNTFRTLLCPHHQGHPVDGHRASSTNIGF